MDRDIAPLAKRLAEENNVDWRSLKGSGHDGRIVERDVLDYLARVMAGEADVDPTPEPVPEGMDAWPDADRDGAPAPEPAGAPPPAATPPDDEDDGLLLAGDDLFEGERSDLAVEADGASGTATARDAAVPEAAAGPSDRDDDLVGSDGGLWQDPPPGPTSSADADAAPDLFLDDDSGLGAAGGDRSAHDPEEGGGNAFDFGGMPGAETVDHEPTREPPTAAPPAETPAEPPAESPAAPAGQEDDLAFDLGAAEPDDPAVRDDLSHLEATDTGVRPAASR